MDRILKTQEPMSSDAEAYSATALKLSREVQRTTKVELDVAYGPEAEQRLDLYFPKESSSSPVPVLLFMHGGGWARGYKEWMGVYGSGYHLPPGHIRFGGLQVGSPGKVPRPAGRLLGSAQMGLPKYRALRRRLQQALYRGTLIRRTSSGTTHSPTRRRQEPRSS